MLYMYYSVIYKSPQFISPSTHYMRDIYAGDNNYLIRVYLVCVFCDSISTPLGTP